MSYSLLNCLLTKALNEELQELRNYKQAIKDDIDGFGQWKKRL